MSSMRQDPSHGPGPAGGSRTRTESRIDAGAGASSRSSCRPRTRRRACPQLVDEIAAALRRPRTRRAGRGSAGSRS